jgi:Domain of unknown function (DUF6378)
VSADYEPSRGIAALQEALSSLYETGKLVLPDGRTVREAVLDDAKQAVCSDRNAEYGEPIDNLGRWAEAVNGLGYRVLVPGSGGAAWRELKPHDMAVIMGVGKYARLMHSPEKADHWVDAAGYPAIGFECVTLED